MIIFGMYGKNEGYHPSNPSQKQYYAYDRKTRTIEPYSRLLFTRQDRFGFHLSLTEEFSGKGGRSVFHSVPREIYVSAISPNGIPEVQCISNAVHDRCAFVSPNEKGAPDKSIQLLDFSTNTKTSIGSFPYRDLPISHGGGGYADAYLLNDHEVLFLEYPKEEGPLAWFGIGMNRRAYLKVLDVATSATSLIDELDGQASTPKLSRDKTFVVYGIWNANVWKERRTDIYDIWVKHIPSGEVGWIGQGHSPCWME